MGRYELIRAAPELSGHQANLVCREPLSLFGEKAEASRERPELVAGQWDVGKIRRASGRNACEGGQEVTLHC